MEEENPPGQTVPSRTLGQHFLLGACAQGYRLSQQLFGEGHESCPHEAEGPEELAHVL